MHDDFSNEEMTQLQHQIQQNYDDLKTLLEDDGEAGVVELDQSRMGRLSRIDAIQRQQMAKMHRDRMKKQLQEIFLASKRMELYPEDFGYCEECDDVIPFQRLLARPETRFCVPCLKNRGG